MFSKRPLVYLILELCMVSNRISDYTFISQGKTRIPGVNDSEEAIVTDVSSKDNRFHLLISGSAHIATKFRK